MAAGQTLFVRLRGLKRRSLADGETSFFCESHMIYNNKPPGRLERERGGGVKNARKNALPPRSDWRQRASTVAAA